MMDWRDHGEHMTTGGWVFMVIGLLVLVALAVMLVIWLTSQRKPARGLAPPGVSAREILDHRLVNGEVTADQYDELRKRLEASPPNVAPSAGP